MKKASVLTAVTIILSLFLVSGAYAQYQGMGRVNSNRYYEGATPPPAAFSDHGMAVERGRSYYEPQMPPQGFSNAPRDVFTFESVVPPPTASDIRSEQINRKHDRPAQVYVERQQGVPTSIAPEGNRRAMRGERPSAPGYYPQPGQQRQQDMDRSY